MTFWPRSRPSTRPSNLPLGPMPKRDVRSPCGPVTLRPCAPPGTTSCTSALPPDTRSARPLSTLILMVGGGPASALICGMTSTAARASAAAATRPREVRNVRCTGHDSPCAGAFLHLHRQVGDDLVERGGVRCDEGIGVGNLLDDLQELLD